jgi:glutamate formiminotransferase
MLVACNVYISAGESKYVDFLTTLLKHTQDHCHQIMTDRRTDVSLVEDALSGSSISTATVVVVHAFSDGPYNRSSFHVAGMPNLVVAAVSSLTTHAIEGLEKMEHTHRRVIGNDNRSGVYQRRNRKTPHPTVGLVDHVAVLPLHKESVRNDINESSTGWVANQIGASLEAIGIDVLYYGNAHPDQTSLATVRREKTAFFQDNVVTKGRGQATVGASPHFTENFNIRLKSGIPKKVAQTLTKHVRERDGMGLPFVEALTLPYSNDRYEVACNLLNPTLTSAQDIVDRIQSWQYVDQNLVETCYRVGTTAEMCWDALESTQTPDGEQRYNEQVLNRFLNRQ